MTFLARCTTSFRKNGLVMNSSALSTMGRSLSSISPRLARKMNGIFRVCSRAWSLSYKPASVEPGHAVVADNQVRRIVHDFQKRIGAVGCRARVAMRRKPLDDQVEDQGIIVHDQDFDIFHGRHRLPLFGGRR